MSTFTLDTSGTPKELTARVVPGPKPGALDAQVEAVRRGLGSRQANWFISGVYIATIGLPSVLHGHARKWEEAGEKWACEEIERRASLDDAGKVQLTALTSSEVE